MRLVLIHRKSRHGNAGRLARHSARRKIWPRLSRFHLVSSFYRNLRPKRRRFLTSARSLKAEPRKLSPDFLELLNDVLVKHEWYREYLEERQAEKLSFVGKFRIADGVQRVSADLSSFLSVEQSRRASHTWDEFLRQLSRTAEAQGILVMRSGIVRGNTRRKLSVHEFRGFVISDALAPLVFINGRDSKAAQIFTLVHELVHIWIDRSGISNPDPKEIPDQQKNAIERFCNSATAEVLVPQGDFLKSLPAAFNDQTIQKLAAQYRVSTIVILRRAYELGTITKSNFFNLLGREQQKQKEREEKEEEEPTSGGEISTSPCPSETAADSPRPFWLHSKPNEFHTAKQRDCWE